MLTAALTAAAFACGADPAEPALESGPPEPSLEAAPAGAPALRFESLPSPAGTPSRAPGLSVGADGLTYLTWVEPLEDGHRLFYSSFLSGGWTTPIEVARGENWIVSGTEAPGLSALVDGTLLVHWIIRRPGPVAHATYVYFTVSGDRGLTWTRPRRMHDDRSAVEHGFVTAFPFDGRRFGVVWLDGRGTLEDGPGTGLYLRTVDGSSRLGEETLLDERVCDCCATSAATLPGVGPLVVYRDRSPGEVRDIALVRRDGHGWSAPRTVRHDSWETLGCPVNGPSVAVQDRIVLAGWYTEGRAHGPAGEGHVVAARSRDGGTTFRSVSGLPERVPHGQVQAALLAGGRGLLTWRDGSRWLACEVDVSGAAGPALELAPAESGPVADRARLATTGGGALFAWVDPATSGVRVGRLTCAAD